MNPAHKTVPATLAWREGELYLLDQTRLPLEIVIERQDSAEQVWHSIQQLKVRGAPAIGVVAAYGLCVAMMKPHRNQALTEFRAQLQHQAHYLESSTHRSQPGLGLAPHAGGGRARERS